jgi:hypothetical protein
VAALSGPRARAQPRLAQGADYRRASTIWRASGAAENLVVVCQRVRTLLRQEPSQRHRNGHRRNAALAAAFVPRLLLQFEMRCPLIVITHQLIVASHSWYRIGGIVVGLNRCVAASLRVLSNRHHPSLRRHLFVNRESAQTLRSKLTFEQQARFDALYERRQKKAGTARVLSLPLLGTFGLDQFYLGHTVRGVISLVFFWTLIPTVVALFDLISGDINRQVEYANRRIAAEVYDNVVKNTTTASDIPAAAASVVNPPAPPVAPAPAPAPAEPDVVPVAAAAVAASAVAAAEAAPSAETAPPAAVSGADSIVDAAPAQQEVAAVAEEQDATETTTGTITHTESTAVWQAGMDQPQTTSDTQTVTFGETDTVASVAAEVIAAPAAEEAAAVVVDAAPPATAGDTPPATASLDDTPVVVVMDAPAEEGAAAVVVEATPAPAPTDFAAGEGVLVFLEDAAPADTAPTDAAPTEVVTDAQQTEQTEYQETIAESDSVGTQHYVDGKLVSTTRATSTTTGDINTLITEHQDDALFEEVAARAGMPIGWIDASPLHSEATTPSATTPDAGTPAAATDAAPEAQANATPTDAGGTDTPGGGLGGTATPGGDNGGTDTPGGGIGSSPTEGGEGVPPHPVHGGDSPIPE